MNNQIPMHDQMVRAVRFMMNSGIPESEIIQIAKMKWFISKEAKLAILVDAGIKNVELSQLSS